MIGAALLRLRTRYGRRLRVAYYRDWVRPQILQTSPITGTTDNTCEIHVLTSSQDSLNLVWALKSFYWSSQRKYSLCIHDDGSLSSNHIAALSRHFPEARMVLKSQAD